VLLSMDIDDPEAEAAAVKTGKVLPCLRQLPDHPRRTASNIYPFRAVVSFLTHGPLTAVPSGKHRAKLMMQGVALNGEQNDHRTCVMSHSRRPIRGTT
jgi:hypothetical protein